MCLTDYIQFVASLVLHLVSRARVRAKYYHEHYTIWNNVISNRVLNLALILCGWCTIYFAVLRWCWGVCTAEPTHRTLWRRCQFTFSGNMSLIDHSRVGFLLHTFDERVTRELLRNETCLSLRIYCAEWWLPHVVASVADALMTTYGLLLFGSNSCDVPLDDKLPIYSTLSAKMHQVISDFAVAWKNVFASPSCVHNLKQFRRDLF